MKKAKEQSEEENEVEDDEEEEFIDYQDSIDTFYWYTWENF